VREKFHVCCTYFCPGQVDNHGCYGGDQGRAFDWVFKHGGMARNEEYPYRGINDFCKADVDVVEFEGMLASLGWNAASGRHHGASNHGTLAALARPRACG
jgi:hypothetical protein